MKSITLPFLVVCAMSCAPTAYALSNPLQGTWVTTLQGRDLDGNAANGFEAYYDTALRITWLADANLPKTQGMPSNGGMSWSAANTWARNLSVFGVTGWRLPLMIDLSTNGCTQFSSSGGLGADCGYNVDTNLSELAHLFHVTLGNSSNTSGGLSLSNTGPFKNVVAYNYWSNEAQGYYQPGTAWYFSTYNGHQFPYLQSTAYNVWAVRTGDVAAVPEPMALALSLAGLAVVALGRQRT